jgi:hypothetical protein
LTLLFAATLFLSAALLFCLQPLLGKMLLPLLGGAPAVWNTCMVFFQAALLLGYAYTHWSIRWLGPRRQPFLHVPLMLVAFVVLPVRLSAHALASVPVAGNPIPWLLATLTVTAGLPFLAVSTTAPLLQRWFAGTGHKHAHDPYFLYAASNAGSLIGLLGYPLALEPTIGLAQQSRWWAIGYGALVVGVAGCAVIMWRRADRASDNADAPTVLPATPPTWPRRARWIVLAFAPSSLMLGLTTYVTTDVAAFPLLWVVPLALYLATFILVFARRPVLTPPWAGRFLSLLSVVLIIAAIVEGTHPAGLLLVLHGAMFVTAAMICHGELAKDRPAPEHLTEFFLCLSAGGVLGGLFNALIAPVLFTNVIEYPLVIALACALRPASAQSGWRGADVAWAAGIGLASGALMAGTRILRQDAHPLSVVWIFALPAVATYRFVERPVRFGLCLVGVIVAGLWYTGPRGRPLHAERNFFGVLRVTIDPTGQFRQLLHGHTLHGRQSLDPARRTEPLAYFHPSGPVGRVFELFTAVPRVAVIGLGAGSMASYARADQRWTFYEIDPAVERIARDARFFRFLPECPAASLSVVLGDARLRLREAPDREYGLIVMDAFSSDAIPAHLLTREALQLYLAKLDEAGVMAMNISNRRLDLEPVVAALAADAGLICLARNDEVSPRDRARGIESSHWAVLARSPERLSPLANDARWCPATTRRGVAAWTDDYSNLVRVLKWR